MALDGKSLQEYPVNAGIPQGSNLVLHFSYFTLITSLIMLSVILLYTLMILLSILSVIRHQISTGFVDWSNNTGFIDVKMDGSVPSGKIIF